VEGKTHSVYRPQVAACVEGEITGVNTHREEGRKYPRGRVDGIKSAIVVPRKQLPGGIRIERDDVISCGSANRSSLTRSQVHLGELSCIAIINDGTGEGEVGVGQTPLEAFEYLKERDAYYGYGELVIEDVTILKVEAYAKPEIRLEVNWLTPESM